MTDGDIHDMRKVVDMLYDTVEYPLSIIIIGVGNANFGKMKILDGD